MKRNAKENDNVSKPAFLQKEPLTRFGVAFLLTVGIALPLLLALDLGGHALSALLIALGMLAVLTVMGVSRKTCVLLLLLVGTATIFQLFLPGMGLLGAWVEAFKALALFFSGYSAVLPLFGAQVASLIAVLTAVLGYVFSKRGVGFLPAALVVLLLMFGLWSLGQGSLLWYVTPALVAILLMRAQSAHEKINALHVLPMALAAVLLSMLITPSGRVVIEPLATAASDLKQAISDYLFFTEPRDVFTIGAYGFYPMGSNQLGGEAEPNEYPVMTVKTGQKTLLRAVSRDYYDGRAFTDTSSPKRYLYINPRWQAQRREAFLELMPGDAILKASTLLDQKAISVQMQNSAASTVFTPLFLRSLNMQNDMVPYFNDSSELFITRDLQRDDRYTVYTPVFEGGDTGLDALVNAAQKTDAYYQELLSTYTQLPSHMEQKVFDDINSIVAQETTPYGKAMAIMRHLQKYYHYTLTPETPPQNKDFVTYFLYVGKEGYCTYFASAMTVMCRMVGLPARYVEGFLAQPGADGLAYVTGKDAHAWTEVYFEGFGWVPFDPTPLQQDSGSTPPQSDRTEPTPTPSPEPQGGATPTPPPDNQQSSDEPSPEPSDQPQDQTDQNPDSSPDESQDSSALCLLVALAALLAALGARIALRSPDRMVARKATEREKIFVYAAAVQQLLNYHKRKPKPGEAPLVYAGRIDAVHAFPVPILPLWRVLTLCNYARVEPTHPQTTRARDTYRGAYHSASLLHRVKFRLSSAFNMRFYRVLDTPMPHDKPPVKLTFKPPKTSPRDEAEARAALRREKRLLGTDKPIKKQDKPTTLPKPAREADRKPPKP
jgi:hypothetical protein